MFNKFNFYKNLKSFLIAFAVIILAGVLVGCFCGFNLGVDFAGGSSFSVAPQNASTLSDENFNKNFADKKDEIISSVKSVLKKNNVKLDKVQFVGEENGMSILFTIKNKQSVHKDDIESFNSSLKEKVSEEVSKVSTEIVLETSNFSEISKSSSMSVLLESAAFCLLLVLVFAYIAIRFFPYGAITTVFGIILDVLLFLAVVICARVEVTKFVSCGALICIALQTIYQILILSQVKEAYIAKEHEEKNNDEIVSNSIKKVSSICVITSSIFVVLSIVLMFINLEIGTYIGIATIISTVTSLFFSPVLFGIITSKKAFIPRFNKVNK